MNSQVLAWRRALSHVMQMQPQTQSGRPLTQVYQNDDFQITGISVSKNGRLFVNFPRWSDRYLNAVIEVKPDGSTAPFPDETWNRWDLKRATAGDHFICVQSVVVDDSDSLWILDPASPLQAGVVPGGAKLVKIDLHTNQVDRVISLGDDVAKHGSYLNDIRFDLDRNAAYITDSGDGALVVLDLQTGKARRVLEGHPSTVVEPGVQIIVEGKTLLFNGKPPQFNADSIALSPDKEYLYYKPLTANTLSRIRTGVLRDAAASSDDVAAAVEKVAEIYPTDGFWIDAEGNLYLSDVTHNAVARRSPDGKLQPMVQDARLQWPDTFSEGPDGAIYISASHINNSPMFNQGKSTRKQPYAVFKFQP
jgi:sugar lactone lactonase YvrE